MQFNNIGAKHLIILKPQQATLDWISELILQREQVWPDRPGILHVQPRCPLAPPLTCDLTCVWVGLSWLKQAKKPLFVQPVRHACVVSTHRCAPTCHLYLNWDSPIPLDHLRAFLPPSAGLGQHAVGLACLWCLHGGENVKSATACLFQRQESSWRKKSDRNLRYDANLAVITWEK